MPRVAARFCLSLKDNTAGTALKVELIDALGMGGERRYRLRVNGRAPARI